MNDIKFNCPQCGQHLVIDITRAGTTTACPKCGQAILVPRLARMDKAGTPARVKWWLLPAVGIIIVLLVVGLIVWLTPSRHNAPADPVSRARMKSTSSLVEKGQLAPETLYGKRFRFVWKWKNESGTNGIATLHNDGTISGIASPNETFWLIDERGQFVFKHRDGRISSIFTQADQQDGKWFFSGPFQFKPGVEHQLEEIGP